MELCTISGTIFNASGDPIANVPVYIIQTRLSGTIIANGQALVATSDENGEIEFTAPRGSTIWLHGIFHIGSQSFIEGTGVALAVPDTATADLEDLPIEVSDPTIFVDTDETLAADSDERVPSQKAIKSYVDEHSGDATGSAGGVLSGSYPNPGFAVNMAEQSEVDAAIASAVSTAASDATTKSNAAQSAAISTASSDATTKANAALASAVAADPVKASGAEVTTGTDDAKFVTPKALSDAGIEPGGGGVINSAGTNVVPKSDGTNLVASSITDDGAGIVTIAPVGDPPNGTQLVIE